MFNEIFTKLNNLIKGDFFQNVTVLMSGTAIAQGLAFAASPILSRLYTPNSFGVFGLFTALCSIIAVVACAKYELAILLPEDEKDAANILWLSMGIISFTTVVTLLIVFLFRENIAELLGNPELAPLLWWAPASIFFTGLYNAFNFWTTRRKQYKRLSISRVVQTTGREGTQLGFAFFSNLQGGGLVLGQVLGQASSAGTLIGQTYREDYDRIKESFNIQRIKALAKEHRDFPKFNAPQNLLNSISQNVPAILLAFFFNPAVVGFYWFTQRILLAPNKLIGNSIRQVFYQRANELVHKGKEVKDLFKKTSSGLAVIAILPLVILLIFGPLLFEFIFGDEWLEAGKYAQWLSIYWFAAFINPPAVMMVPILGLQKFQLYFEIIVSVTRICAVTAGGLYHNPLLSIALFSIAGFLANAYLIYYIGLNVHRKTRDSK